MCLGIPGRITAITDAGRLMAMAEVSGVRREVNVACVAGNDPIHSLSPREGEILRLIAHGASNKLIARELDIAETTVKIHVQHILRKLGLSSRVQAAVYASDRQRAE
mgnify:CR=1 FL=1